MGTREEESGRTRCSWSVFDGVKSFSLAPNSPAAASVPPDTLMAEIDAAIAASEHAHSTLLLRPFGRPQRPEGEGEEPFTSSAVAAAAAALGGSGYEAVGLADEAYRSACAALAAGKPDSALRSLRVALASCPPEKVSAISKLRSLVAFATSQQQRLILQHKSAPS
ncbi:unnamed protein product [Spirodela intermedia]|uniref:Uncharacterized protein n=2 Tax=Spirodela intermedia TaxID=51605 RepID=A0A7I8J4A5_SPIIN|nr:unnamed protein product [Spirodela intermedia]CAA6664939.1 unnamed protein product [Spirodela intermedia]CAA7401577.1 unnamed protein product [Spirodela intermedia]